MCVDAENDPELFWALRGGIGANFGIVTADIAASPCVVRAPGAWVAWSGERPAKGADSVIGGLR